MDKITAGFRALGVEVPKILLPRPGTDLTKWAVVACDQYTSEPEYWDKVENLVGTSPSTLRLVFPEIYLEEANSDARIVDINATMQKYLNTGILEEQKPGFIYVERTTNGRTRRGLILALDLDCYDYNKGSKTLIRATEGTVLSRIPPRVKIRQNAPIELPHILMLIDDPKGKVIEPLSERTKSLEKTYDFDLMMDGGQITGYRVEKETDLTQVLDGLNELYQSGIDGLNKGTGDPLLFAAGDGNHSLATAKTVWENIKGNLTATERENHPARFALVEVVNVHDRGLVFEPIHRVVFNVNPQDLVSTIGEISNPDQDGGGLITYIHANVEGQIKLFDQNQNLVVGNLQVALDGYLKSHPEARVDYVHGKEVVKRLGSQPGNLGLLLPAMDKNDLFKTVVLEGALPRKTFSMGEANEKRYYLEARKIC